jgi:hypothetical protein
VAVRDLKWWLAARDRQCRLSPEWALATLDEAAEFLRDRGLLTLMADSWLPSLFEACHEEPYSSHARGFGGWPKTRWVWAGQLASRPDVVTTRLHRGKLLYVSAELEPLLAAVCRKSAADAADGALGSDAARLMAVLAQGPVLQERIYVPGLSDKAVRQACKALERAGAIFTEEVRLESRPGGHLHSLRLMRADQHERRGPRAAVSFELALDEFLLSAVHAAVVAPMRDALRWFTWPVGQDTIDRLIESGRLVQPEAGWVAYSHPVSRAPWRQDAAGPSPSRALSRG